MKTEAFLRAILPDVLIDNFDVVNFEKSDPRFDIYLDEKKVLMREDKKQAMLYHMFFAIIAPFRILAYNRRGGKVG